MLKWNISMGFAWIKSPYVGKEIDDKSEDESIFGIDEITGSKPEFFTVVLQFGENDIFVGVESPNYDELAQENVGFLDIRPMEVEIENMKFDIAAKSAGDENVFVPCDAYFLDDIEIDFSATEIDASLGNWLYPRLGYRLYLPPAEEYAIASLKRALGAFNTHPASRTYLVGEDEKNVRALFTLAAKVPPTIFFVDEVDSLLGQWNRTEEHEVMRKIKNEFMTHWDGLLTKTGERMLVLAATNRPFDLDEAIIRRFEKRIMAALPSIENREKNLRTLLSKEKNLGTKVSDDELWCPSWDWFAFTHRIPLEGGGVLKLLLHGDSWDIGILEFISVRSCWNNLRAERMNDEKALPCKMEDTSFACSRKGKSHFL